MSHGHHSNAHSSHDTHELPGHILPLSLYRNVLLALLFLTAITVTISRFDFGSWNLVAAMVIASIKAGLVTMFFMHLKYENKITWLYVLFPIVLLFVMIGGLFSDNPLRIHVEPVKVIQEGAK